MLFEVSLAELDVVSSSNPEFNGKPFLRSYLKEKNVLYGALKTTIVEFLDSEDAEMLAEHIAKGGKFPDKQGDFILAKCAPYQVVKDGILLPAVHHTMKLFSLYSSSGLRIESEEQLAARAAKIVAQSDFLIEAGAVQQTPAPAETVVVPAQGATVV